MFKNNKQPEQERQSQKDSGFVVAGEEQSYTIEALPDEWAGYTSFEVDLAGYLEKKLDLEGKIFCGFVPRPDGLVKEVIFLKWPRDTLSL